METQRGTIPVIGPRYHMAVTHVRPQRVDAAMSRDPAGSQVDDVAHRPRTQKRIEGVDAKYPCRITCMDAGS